MDDNSIKRNDNEHAQLTHHSIHWLLVTRCFSGLDQHSGFVSIRLIESVVCFYELQNIIVKVKGNIGGGFHNVQGAIGGGFNNVAGVIGSAKDGLGNLVSRGGDQAEDAVNQAKSTTEDLGNKVGQKGKEAGKIVQDK